MENDQPEQQPLQKSPQTQTTYQNQEEEIPHLEKDVEKQGTITLTPTPTPLFVPSLPPITDNHVSSTTKTKPTASRSCRGGRKKCKRVTRKPFLKLEALRKNFQTLSQNLKPIPFIPRKTNLDDFLTHEKLLKRLGLWDFVHLELEECNNNIRCDLIAQLIVSYDKKLRHSEVNGVKIKVSRADLTRALKLPLPVKRDSGIELLFDSEEESYNVDVGCEESVRFLKVLVWNWMLLCEEMLIVPADVSNWMRMIEKGGAEKVEWASFVWLMVERELSQGSKLVDCYYASHLQCLIKSQCETLFLEDVEPEEASVKEDKEEDVDGGDIMNNIEEGEDLGVVKMESEDGADVDVSEHEHAGGDSKISEDNAGLKMSSEVETDVRKSEVDGDMKLNVVVSDEEMNEMEEDAKKSETDAIQHDKVEEPSVGLTLGQHNFEKEQEREGHHAMNIEECGVEEPMRLLFNENSRRGEHFLQPCSLDIVGRSLDFGEEGKQDEDIEKQEEEEGIEEIEEEEGIEEIEEEKGIEEQELQDRGFNLPPKCNTFQGISPSNYIQSVDMALGAYSSPMQLHHQSPVDHHLTSTGETSTAIFRNTTERVIDHNNYISHQQLNGNNKRLRSNGPWGKEVSEFGTCLENIQHWMEKARMMYEVKNNICEELNMNQQLLLNELQQRNNLVEQLQKAKYDLQKKSQVEMHRLERELFAMGSILDFYRKALKEHDQAFSEYRARCQVPDEPLYKDVPGSGGLMLSTMELEKQRLKQEEGDRNKKEENRLRLKQEEEERIKITDTEKEVKVIKDVLVMRKVAGSPESSPTDAE